MEYIFCFDCFLFTDTIPLQTYIGYAKSERTLLFSSVAIGALVAVVPVSHATHAYGTRKVYGILTTATHSSIAGVLRGWYADYGSDGSDSLRFEDFPQLLRRTTIHSGMIMDREVALC